MSGFPGQMRLGRFDDKYKLFTSPEISNFVLISSEVALPRLPPGFSQKFSPPGCHLSSSAVCCARPCDRRQAGSGVYSFYTFQFIRKSNHLSKTCSCTFDDNPRSDPYVKLGRSCWAWSRYSPSCLGSCSSLFTCPHIWNLTLSGLGNEGGGEFVFTTSEQCSRVR